MRSRIRVDRIRLITQLIAILLLLALLAAMLITEGLRAASSVLLETVRLTDYTYTDTLYGYILRDESALESNNNGPVEYAVKNGEAVAAQDVIARVYIDDTDTDKRERAAAMYAEIDALEAALSAADTHWQASYVTDYAALMQALGTGRLTEAAQGAQTLSASLTGRDAASADTADALRARIAALREELADLVRHVDAPQSVQAAADGIFYRETDGYEALLGTQDALTLSASALDAVLSTPQSTQNSIGKVIGGGTWYLALPVSAALAEAYTQGQHYAVCLDGAITLTLELAAINADPDSDRFLLILKGEEYPASLGTQRRRTARVEKETVTGLCIPADALQEGDGVFVEENGVARLRRVTPILREEGCVLVLPDGNLREGERVLLTARKIYDGRVLDGYA